MFDFLKKKCHTCYFFQNSACILHKKRCLPCDMKVKKINGIAAGAEFYINYMNSRKISIRSLWISSISLIISFLALIVNYMKVTGRS